MNCANGSCSLRNKGLLNGLLSQQPQVFNLNGAAFQRFGNNSFNRLQQLNGNPMFRMF